MAWENEANWPEAWTVGAGAGIYFSPMVKSGSEYIVYATGYGVLKLYKYSLTTQTWTYLNTTPVQLYRAMSMSPDETKLAAHGIAGNILYIYDITGNSWTTSATAPNFITGETPEMCSTVWTDDDTVWCHFRASAGGMRNKCYKYEVEADTWTQYTNAYLNSTYNASKNMSVNSAGTALFVGGVYPPVEDVRSLGFKYVIANDTDTYSKIELRGHGTGGYDWLVNSDRSAKLWYIDALTPAPLEIFYYDCDTEYEGGVPYTFPGDPERDVGYQNLPCGIYGINYIIAWNRTTEPQNRSYLIITAPSVTTGSATSVEAETAVGNGKITDNGGEDCDKRGFVYNTSHHGDPGDKAPVASGYADYVEETGSFGTGDFTLTLINLKPKTIYYVRAYAHNSAGYSYGNEVSFTTLAAIVGGLNPALMELLIGV